MRIATARAWRARAMPAGKRHAYLDNLPDPTFSAAGGPFNLLIQIAKRFDSLDAQMPLTNDHFKRLSVTYE